MAAVRGVHTDDWYPNFLLPPPSPPFLSSTRYHAALCNLPFADVASLSVHGVECARGVRGGSTHHHKSSADAAAAAAALPWWASAHLSVDMCAAIDACTSVNTGRVVPSGAKPAQIQTFRQSKSLLGVIVPPTPILAQKRRRVVGGGGGGDGSGGGSGGGGSGLYSPFSSSSASSAAAAVAQSNIERNMRTLRACIDEELNRQLRKSSGTRANRTSSSLQDTIRNFAEKILRAEVEVKYGGGLGGSIIREEALKLQARKHVSHAVQTFWDRGVPGSESDDDDDDDGDGGDEGAGGRGRGRR